MENNKNKIIHYRSKDTVDNKAKLPSADSLDYGELAINYADGVETIAFKNRSNKIVEIRSNEYIEGIIKDNEETTAASLTDLNRRLENIENSPEVIVPTKTSELINDSGFITIDDIPEEQFKGTVTGVKVNGGNEVQPDGSGVVNLTIQTGEQNVQSDWNETNTSSDAYIKNKPTLSTVAQTGSYNDLSNKPTIPSAVTESTVSGWGFTKNTGTITGISANGTSIATSGAANIPAASTSAYGVTKLSSATNSDSEVLAATPKAVKAAYDLANSYKGTITEVKMNGATMGTSGVVDLGTVITAHQDISGKVDKVDGKGLSTEDFTTTLKQKLESLTNYDDTALSNALTTLRQDFNNLVSGDTTTAIKTFNEIIAFLDGISDSEDLDSIIAGIEQQIAGKQATITDLETIRSGAAAGATAVQPGSLAKVATSGSYNDLTNKPTIPSSVTESTVSGWGFTKNTGTVTGVKINGTTKTQSNGIVDLGTVITEHQDISGKQDTITDLETIRQGAAKGATALQSYTEQYKGTVTGVKINGATKNPSNGVVDLGTIFTNSNVQAIDTGDVLDDVNVEYATKSYVDGLIGDINSVLESIINGGSNPTI